MSSLGHVMQCLGKLSAKESVVVLGSDSVRGAASLDGAEKRILQCNKYTLTGSQKLTHASSDLSAKGWIKSNQELHMLVSFPI